MAQLPGFTAGSSLGATIPAATNRRIVKSTHKHFLVDSVEPARLCHELTVECGPGGCRSFCGDDYPHEIGGGGGGGGGGADGGAHPLLDDATCFEAWQECMRFCDNAPTPQLRMGCLLGCDAVYAACRLLPD